MSDLAVPVVYTLIDAASTRVNALFNLAGKMLQKFSLFFDLQNIVN